MFIIRPISKSDSAEFSKLISNNILGITNLPRNQDILQKQIQKSEASFEKHISHPTDEEYRFVLEDTSTGAIGGVSGILSSVGTHESLLFKIDTLKNNSTSEAIPKEMKILRLIKAEKNTSEVCSLFLHPEFRHSGLGRLLSLSRFLFIASFPQRFGKKIMAVMRAFIAKDDSFPFWDGVGRHFCQLGYNEMMEFLEQNPKIILQVLPQFPLYIDLLTKEAQESIGRCHEQTLPALKMLTDEGFLYDDEIDVFDGGPAVIAETSKIRTINSSKVAYATITNESLNGSEKFIICNHRIDFRACVDQLKIVGEEKVLISKECAQALKIDSGDKIRYARLK